MAGGEDTCGRENRSTDDRKSQQFRISQITAVPYQSLKSKCGRTALPPGALGQDPSLHLQLPWLVAAPLPSLPMAASPFVNLSLKSPCRSLMLSGPPG